MVTGADIGLDPDMTDPTIEGVCPIIATPFSESGEVDYESLRTEVRILAEDGCHAATLFGIASEFYKLADAERDRMVEVVTEEASKHDLPIVISVTHESTEIAVSWAREYEAAGADCLMVFPPIFMDPTKSEVTEHLVAIAEAVSIPIMVQHTSQNVAMTASDFASLNEQAPNVRYFKIETQPPGPFISELLTETDGSVDVLVGSAGYQMIEAFDRGATGVMPAAIFNELYLEIYESYVAGDRERALELHSLLLPVLNHVSQSPIRYSKRILAERGIVATEYCRRPSGTPTDEHYDELLSHYLQYLDDRAPIDVWRDR